MPRRNTPGETVNAEHLLRPSACPQRRPDLFQVTQHGFDTKWACLYLPPRSGIALACRALARSLAIDVSALPVSPPCVSALVAGARSSLFLLAASNASSRALRSSLVTSLGGGGVTVPVMLFHVPVF